MARAKLINLESLDAGGKGTQAELIKKYFDEQNIKYKYIHFPVYGNNEASAVIAAYLRGEYGDVDKVDPIFVANMYAMDRYLFLPTLEKDILENDVIILDRYIFSNMAYQGAKYNNTTQSKIMHEWIYDFEVEFLDLPYPDLTIFFDVPIEDIEKRLNDKRIGEDRDYLNGKDDIHEKSIEYQKRVHENYLLLSSEPRFHVIPTKDKTPEEIFITYKHFIDNVFL